MNPRIRRALFWTALFATLGLIAVLRHEMWRDELQAWLIGRDAPSLSELFTIVRYQKHPALWYLALRGLSRLTANPLVMQLFHLSMATLSAFLLFAFAPFKPVHKALLGFGYFLVYEYAVISRNYAIGVLALFLFCVAYPRFRRKPLLAAACLVLLANSSLYGLLLAAALGAALLIEVLSSADLRRRLAPYAALLVIGLGGILSALQMRPVADGSLERFATLHRTFNPGLLADVLILIPRSFLPFPAPMLRFWNHFLIDWLPAARVVEVVLAVLFIAFAVWILRKSRAALIFYGLGTAFILAWSYTALVGYARHYGHLFIVFVGALWLAGLDGAGPKAGPASRPSGRGLANAVLLAVFSIQALAGIFALAMDIRHPFSQGKAVASLIKAKGYERLPIVAYIPSTALSVVGYLDHEAYYMGRETSGTYLSAKHGTRKKVQPSDILDRARLLTQTRKRDCLIVMSMPLGGGFLNTPGLLTFGKTPPAVVQGEEFFIYLLRYDESPGRPSAER